MAKQKPSNQTPSSIGGDYIKGGRDATKTTISMTLSVALISVLALGGAFLLSTQLLGVHLKFDNRQPQSQTTLPPESKTK